MSELVGIGRNSCLVVTATTLYYVFTSNVCSLGWPDRGLVSGQMETKPVPAMADVVLLRSGDRATAFIK